MSRYSSFKIAKNSIMDKFNLSRKLFDMDDISSDASEDSVIYTSSGEEDPSED